MKICPVCNESFADQLNFCDIDGTRLTREGSAQERNKLWSLIGAGLLVGALIISAASMFFLPKARVSNPIVSSEPTPSPAPAKPETSESAATVAAAPAEPVSAPVDAMSLEVKRKDKGIATENVNGAAPNPKAAALAAEDADKKPAPIDVKDAAATPSSKKADASTGSASAGETRSVEGPSRSQPPSDLKDTKTTPAVVKAADKEAADKKKTDEKDKKKGGFLRVFKKIFGKD